MTLRLKLALALVIATLLPMGVAVGVAMLRAERRAAEDASRRLETARRRAAFLLDRHSSETVARLDQAADDLARDVAAARALLRAESRPASSELARTLATRAGLDDLEILSAEGTTLSGSRQDASTGLRSAFADLGEDNVVVRVVPRISDSHHAGGPESSSMTQIAKGAHGPSDVPALPDTAAHDQAPSDPDREAGALDPSQQPSRPDPGGEAVFVYARRRVTTSAATFFLAGGREVGSELISTIAAVSGEPAALLDASGAVVLASGDRAAGEDAAAATSAAGVQQAAAGVQQAAADRISTDLPLGGSRWSVRVSIPSGDVRHTRAELLAIFAGIAPFALASALGVGLVLAEGISRPIRALTSRAEAIARERAGPLPLPLLDVRDEVMRLTLCFDQMLDALSESERQRIGAERIAAWQEVAQRIAHEVKNPLSPIKLAVENLRRMRATGAGDFDRAFDEESSAILEEVESLRRLVDEFSQFVRLPRPRLVPCDLRELTAQALALFAPKLEEARVRVDVDDDDAPASVAADPEQIGRVLKNVLANAIEALEGARERAIRIVLGEERDGRGASWATIGVRDSGAGLSPEAQRRIFEPYFTTRPDRGGTGLGMAISYRIVTEHGGTIRAEGSPGRGATITIRLPLDREGAAGDDSGRAS